MPGVRLLLSGEWLKGKLSPEVRDMSKSLTADMPKDDAELEAAIENIFVALEREHEKMKEDQEEIDRLKARTRAILAQLKAA